MRAQLSTAVVLAGAVLASACVSLLPEPPPPPVVYSLRAGPVEPRAQPLNDMIVLVSEPSAPQSAAGADIVWRKGRVIAVMDRGAWDGPTPDLLQAMLADTLERRRAVRAVVRTGAGVRADAEIRWAVLAFEVVEDAGRLEAQMRVSATLIDARQRTVIATRRFEANAPISERSGRQAAAALERAAQQLVLELADWASAEAQSRAASTSR